MKISKSERKSQPRTKKQKPLHPNNNRTIWLGDYALYPSQRRATRKIKPGIQKQADRVAALRRRLGYTLDNIEYILKVELKMPLSHYTIKSMLSQWGVEFPPRIKTREAFQCLEKNLRKKLRSRNKQNKQQ